MARVLLAFCGQFGGICGQLMEIADNCEECGQLGEKIGENCGQTDQKYAEFTKIRRKIEQKLLISSESTSQTCPSL